VGQGRDHRVHRGEGGHGRRLTARRGGGGPRCGRGAPPAPRPLRRDWQITPRGYGIPPDPSPSAPRREGIASRPIRRGRQTPPPRCRKPSPCFAAGRPRSMVSNLAQSARSADLALAPMAPCPGRSAAAGIRCADGAASRPIPLFQQTPPRSIVSRPIRRATGKLRPGSTVSGCSGATGRPASRVSYPVRSAAPPANPDPTMPLRTAISQNAASHDPRDSCVAYGATEPPWVPGTPDRTPRARRDSS
jgi:hypothetical protein